MNSEEYLTKDEIREKIAGNVEQNKRLRKLLRATPEGTTERDRMIDAIRAAYRHLDTYGVAAPEGANNLPGREKAEYDSQTAVFDLLRPFTE